MTFKGVLPKGQPRTLRTIAQTKGAAPANLESDAGYDLVSGIPNGFSGANQPYKDAAAPINNPLPSAGKKSNGADKSAFTNVKRPAKG